MTLSYDFYELTLSTVAIIVSSTSFNYGIYSQISTLQIWLYSIQAKYLEVYHGKLNHSENYKVDRIYRQRRTPGERILLNTVHQ